MGAAHTCCYHPQMSEQSEQREPQRQQPPPTPFDHPLFLPIILVGLALWFGYDGFIEDDPAMLEHLTFNRVGFAILAVAALWFGYKGVKEWKQGQREDSDSRGGEDLDG